ncbi:MAG: hypothetical protein DRP32_06090 [Thermotogae bacterium]|nr:MAG: hypothetical protein DRP32_06090 [Thermotogota bacterium]
MLRKHYKILQAQTPVQLEDLVNDWVNKREEWQIIGGIVVLQGGYGTIYAQTLKRQYRVKSHKGPSQIEMAAIKNLREDDTDGSELT